MADAIPTPFLLTFAAIFGSLIGSFLNVCIYRLPRGLSVVAPRSACPRCGMPIPAIRNVPVLSWLLLGGRGACCGGAISARYPFVEALAALSAVLLFAQNGFTVEGFARFVCVALLIVLFFTDLDERLLPDAVTLPGTVAGLALSFARPSLGSLSGPGLDALPSGEDLFGLTLPLGWKSAAFAAFLGAGMLQAVAMLWGWLRHVEAVGRGDIKMMALIGAFLGLPGTLVAFLLASLFGAVIGIGIAAAHAARRTERLAKRRSEVSVVALAAGLFFRGLRRKTIPFGCFLSIGAAGWVFAGESLIAGYLRLSQRLLGL